MDAVIFDIDGTLLHSVEADEMLLTQAIQTVIDNAVIRPAYGDYTHMSDAGILAGVLEDNAIDVTSSVGIEIKRYFIQLLTEHVETNGPFPQFPGARGYIQKYVDSPGHAVGIATGCWRDSALLKLESAGFGDLVVPVATSDDAMDRIGIMQHALSQLSGEFASVTYYGDGEWDRRATEELGWNFVPVGAALGGLLSYEGR